ncbi:hypothetical protein KW791_03350 [Candidatus Parcubacteria bacterium]|nr:hypothetical protein [Candidatus Parcubacteria bacterium]
MDLPEIPSERKQLTEVELMWRRLSEYNPDALCHVCNKKNQVKTDNNFYWQLCESCFKKGWRPPMKGQSWVDGKLMLMYTDGCSSIGVSAYA